MSTTRHKKFRVIAGLDPRVTRKARHLQISVICDVELPIIALDEIEASRKRSGFERQFMPESIANRHVTQGAKYFGSVE